MWSNAVAAYSDTLNVSTTDNDLQSSGSRVNGDIRRVCSLHFEETDFETIGGKRKLKKNAVPSIFPAPLASDENSGQLPDTSGRNSRKNNVYKRVPLRNISNCVDDNHLPESSRVL